MKKRGENLSKYYPQAFEYWLRLVPNRPQYVILCNFDEFWIFDFDLQLDEPVDIISFNFSLVRGVGGDQNLNIQSFILQCVLAMFAEDRGLLPRDLFISCVEECLNGASSYDVFTGLFQAMNTPGITPTGKYHGVEYFNGGLFKNIYP